MKEKLPGQPQSPETAKAIQTRSGKETEEPEHSAGVEVETIIKEKAPTPMPEIVTEEPEFELDDIDTKILPPRPQYCKGKHEDEQFNKFVDMVRRLSINMPLLDALQVPTYSRYFKGIWETSARYRQALSS